MKNYLLVYRTDYSKLPPRDGGEQAQAITKRWMDWMGAVAAKGQLGEQGRRLGFTGKVVKPGNVITNGPYTEIKESIGGYSIVKANSYEDAIEIAKGCPILTMGGNVEVREVDEL